MTDRANWMRVQPRVIPLMGNQIEADRVIAEICCHGGASYLERLMNGTLFRPITLYTKNETRWFETNQDDPVPAELQNLRKRTLQILRRCSSTEERGDSKPQSAGSTPATAAKGQG